MFPTIPDRAATDLRVGSHRRSGPTSRSPTGQAVVPVALALLAPGG